MVPKKTDQTIKAGWHKNEDTATPKKLKQIEVADNHTMGPKKEWVEDTDAIKKPLAPDELKPADNADKK